MSYSDVLPDNDTQNSMGVKINIIYHNDLNLLNLHDSIRYNFKSEMTHGYKLLEKANSILLEIPDNSYNINDNYSKIQKEKLISEGRHYCSGMRWNTYILKAKPILDSYIKVMSDNMKGIISTEKNVEDKSTVKKRIEIIESYISLLSDFYEVSVYRTLYKDSKCPVCGRIQKISQDIDTKNCYVCKCGYSENIVCRDISCPDVNHVSYEKENNLITDNVKRYCGKRNDINIDSNIYVQIDNFLKKIGSKTGEYYRNLPKEKIVNKEQINNKNGTSVEQLLNILKETNNSQYYDHVNIIGSIYFGWILPDLHDHEPYIIEMGAEAKNIYSSYKTKRISSLNGNVMLYFIIKYLEIPYDRNDFKLMNTKESFDEYKDIWDRISKNDNIKFIKSEHNKFIKSKKINK